MGSEVQPQWSAVGVIGCGKMGIGLVHRLIAQGYEVHAYDANSEAQAAAEKEGARPHRSPAEVAREVGVVITMLRDSVDVEKVLFGEGGVVWSGRPDPPFVIDMTSGDPTRTAEFGERLVVLGATIIDAPVSGGITGAANGTLTIMVSGNGEAVERATPLLHELGERVYMIGDLGAGQALKAVNNCLYAINLIASAEAITALKLLGIDSSTAVEVIAHSSGRNRAIENRFRTNVLKRDFTRAMSAALMRKDVSHSVTVAEHVGGAHKTMDLALAMFDEYCSSGNADEVDFGIVRMIESAVGAEIA